MDKLSNAVDVLCRASEANIKDYTASLEPSKATAALSKLQCLTRQLQDCLVRDNDRASKFAQSLLAMAKETHDLFSKNPSQAVGKRPWEKDDYRLVDICLGTGIAGKKGYQAKLRHILSQLSLALEYNAYSTKRLDWMVTHKSFQPSRERTHSVRGFVRERFDTGYENAARLAVNAGLKTLAVSGLLPSWGKGIFGVLMLAPPPKQLTLSSIVGILESPGLSEVKKLAERISPWMNKAQENYNKQGSKKRSIEDGEGGRPSKIAQVSRADVEVIHCSFASPRDGRQRSDGCKSLEPQQTEDAQSRHSTVEPTGSNDSVSPGIFYSNRASLSVEPASSLEAATRALEGLANTTQFVEEQNNHSGPVETDTQKDTAQLPVTTPLLPSHSTLCSPEKSVPELQDTLYNPSLYSGISQFSYSGEYAGFFLEQMNVNGFEDMRLI